MKKSCLGPQKAALIPGISGLDFCLLAVNSAIDSALEKEKAASEERHFREKTSFKCPLGNEPEDLSDWQEVAEDTPDPTPKAFLPNDVRAKMRFDRLVRYILKSTSGFKFKNFKKLLIRAKRAIGGGTSERQLKYDTKKLKATGFFDIERSKVGRSHENLVKLTESGIQQKEKLFSCAAKSTPERKPIASSVQSEAKLKKLAHFLTKQLKKKHWDTCKVIYQAETVFKSVFTALKNGVSRKIIIQSYECALHAFHEIATFQGKTFVPSGVANVIRQLSITQSIIDVKNSIELRLNQIYSKFEKPLNVTALATDEVTYPKWEAPTCDWNEAASASEFSKLLAQAGLGNPDHAKNNEIEEHFSQIQTPNSKDLPEPSSMCSTFYGKLKIKNNNALKRPTFVENKYFEPPKPQNPPDQNNKQTNPTPKIGLLRKTVQKPLRSMLENLKSWRKHA